MSSPASTTVDIPDLSGRPRFSLVSAVYDVAAYLPEFIASVDAQTYAGPVEVLMVDDGSTDGSAELLAAWQQRRPDVVRVVRQDNAGQGSARNRGMADARGEWVSFPDPDDAIEPDYLTQVAAFLDQHPDADLVATRRLIWTEGTADSKAQIANTHPLRYLFRDDPYVDLLADGQHFHGPSASAFFRLDRVREHDLTYDTRVRPIFEDGHFTIRYLLISDRPHVGFVGSARYRYRKRADGSSTLQRARVDLGRYDAVLEHGYLDVVRRATERFGAVPNWLATQLVWDLSGYFTMTDSMVPEGVPTSGPANNPVAERMHELMALVLAHLDLDEAVPYCLASVKRIPRHVLQHGYANEPWREPEVLLGPLDEDRRMVQASWFFTGVAAREEVVADGETIAPLHAKTRSLTYAGRTLLRQRILWLPADRAVQVRLDGRPADLVFALPAFRRRIGLPGWMRFQLSDSSAKVGEVVDRVVDPVPTTRDGRRAQRLMRSRRVTRRYGEAWVLMDRIHTAGDSAEVLFKHLRAHEPDVNAWFVLEKGTPEWDRLAGEGFRDRMVAHGSIQFRLLMANARHLISSHADESVMLPASVLELTRPRWLNHFLNHGLIKDDLSHWLNRKELATFVTSSAQEYASIAGDETPYTFTTREVIDSGMPRFDKLLEVGARFPESARDLLLVTPTWRNGLLPRPEVGSQRWGVDPAALDSDFVRSWLAFLGDDRLGAACREQGLTLAFLPHPNLQPLLPHLDLPGHVQPLSYEGHDVQEYFARARVLVTDFSSIAFNAAYLERPLVYFQFDEDVVLGGGHVGQGGYFDYRRDGFGPVETTPDSAVTATLDALAHGPRPAPRFQERIDATFPVRDGRCCERVVEAVRRSTRPTTVAVPTPEMPAPVVQEAGR